MFIKRFKISGIKCFDELEIIFPHENHDLEHFFPKSRYPKRMYEWTNFLWSCKNCNTEKLATFPVDHLGNAILLNPTVEEPLDFFCWDQLSGKMIPNPEPTIGHRATQTRDLLKLDQFSIAEERRNKLANVLYLLSRAVSENPVANDTIDRLRDELTVHRPWLGIVRELFRRPNPKYASLVRAAFDKLGELTPMIQQWL